MMRLSSVGLSKGTAWTKARAATIIANVAWFILIWIWINFWLFGAFYSPATGWSRVPKDKAEIVGLDRIGNAELEMIK